MIKKLLITALLLGWVAAAACARQASTGNAQVLPWINLTHYNSMSASDIQERGLMAKVSLKLFALNPSPENLTAVRQRMEELLSLDAGSMLKLSASALPACEAAAQALTLLPDQDPLRPQLNNLLQTLEQNFKTAIFAPGAKLEFKRNRYDLSLLENNADLTAAYLNLLLDYFSLNPSAQLKAEILPLIAALTELQSGDYANYPFLAFFNAPDNRSWTLKEQHQALALIKAGIIFNNSDWVTRGESWANSLGTSLLSSYGPIYGMTPHPLLYPQEGEGVALMTETLMQLYRVSGKEIYATLGGLTASWWLGNNLRSLPVYDLASGKAGSCLPETGNIEINAKGTCLALLSLLEVQPQAKDYLNFKPCADHAQTYQILEAESGNAVSKEYSVEDFYYPNAQPGKSVSLGHKNTFWLQTKIDRAGEYYLYLIYLKQAVSSGAIAIKVRVDAGQVYDIVQVGTEDFAYYAMDRISNGIMMSPAYHTIGVRFSGLMFTKPALLDAMILQPLLQGRSFTWGNRHMLLLKNYAATEKQYSFSTPANIDKLKADIFSARGSVISHNIKADNLDPVLTVPTQGYALVQWEEK